eukprot:CAMPEP_0179936270 /NCGR_PEP_ID=MMETSP0983-20121128/13595_1 /TAXON_ID=483367 /ORGANISM="non described non described, Strain CCMP 2436" /LENGTH=556 /DNA_ID=CAMNT_0021841697 /DNA_START=258 /DNA_END=1928 /DNA_ORIENTATION=+
MTKNPPPSPATAAPAASGPARKFREVDLRGFLIPLVDDVVRYPSKWPGEYLLGAVDYVQALPEDRGYVVDVRPLKATGNDRWESKRGSKLVQAVDAGKLRVVKEASYDERADVWTVPEQVTMSLFAPIKRPPPDPERVEGGMLEYNELKWRLVRESALVSAAGAAGALAFLGVESAEAYALGATAGIGYLALLSLTVDSVGGGGLAEKLAPLRLVAPVTPFVAFAASNYFSLHQSGVGLSLYAEDGGGFLASGLIPKQQFLAMAVGVLTHRLPLLARELQSILSLGAEEANRQSSQSLQAGARSTDSLPKKGSLAAGAAMFGGAAKAAEVAKAATAAREAGAKAAQGRRRPIVICGPSAVGKSTLIKRLTSELGAGLAFAVSTTTRKPRPGEVEGIDYRFVSVEKFERLLGEGGFVEWVQGGDSTYYGTEAAELRRVGEALGQAAVLDVDVKGAEAVYSLPGLEPCCIFVSPPSLAALESRLRARGTEGETEMMYRMRKASSEIEAAATLRIFEHYLINDDVDKTYAELKQIVLGANRWLAPYDTVGLANGPDAGA